MSDNLSIVRIEGELQDLLTLRSEMEAEGADLSAVESQIQEYVCREVAKVDGIREWMKRAKQEVDLSKAEAAEWKRHADQVDAHIAKVKHVCMYALQISGQTRINGRMGHIRIQPNGGLRAVEITDERLIPEAYWAVQRVLAMAAIRSALEAGLEVPGASLHPRGEHVEIR